MEEQRKSEELLLVKKVETVAQFKNIRVKEIEAFKLEELLREAEQQLKDRESIIKELENRLKNVVRVEEMYESEKRYI